MKVKGTGEYADIICQYIQNSFPKAVQVSKENLLEILTAILIGTKDLRYGSLPKTESLYVIRQTLQKAVDAGVQIPVLIPWGGRKADPRLSVDVAEIAAIKQITAVDEAIKRFYPPGLHIHIRIEDLGAEWIYRTENTDESIERYSSDLVKLVDSLKGNTHIEAIRESLLMDKETYFKASEMYSELLESVIQAQLAYPGIDVETIPEFRTLKQKGWVGEILPEQRDYYIDRYKNLHPELTMEHYVLMLSDYLGGSKARYDLKGRAEPDSSVGSYIQITFVPPIPGVPKKLFDNTLYYRTIPQSSGRTHIAPWRAKGYLKINGNTVTPKLSDFGNIPGDIHKSAIIIQNDNGEDILNIDTDYSVFETGLYYPVPFMI